MSLPGCRLQHTPDNFFVLNDKQKNNRKYLPGTKNQMKTKLMIFRTPTVTKGNQKPPFWNDRKINQQLPKIYQQRIDLLTTDGHQQLNQLIKK